MAPGIIISVQAALDHLQSCINKYGSKDDELKDMQDFVLFRLRSLRTFVICSTKLGNDVQMTSLWGRLGDVFHRILDDEFCSDSVNQDVERFFDNIKPLAVEMDRWFVTLSDYNLQQSTDPPVEVRGQGIDDILCSVVENFENFLMCCDEEDYEVLGHLITPIKALTDYMVFLRNFISFASLLCGDQHREVQNLFTEIEALAVSAGQLAVCFFTYDYKDDVDKMNSISSALLVRIKPFNNPHSCETFSQALSILKNSREFYAPVDESIAVMMNLIGYLLFLLWDLIQPSIIPLQSQLKTLYDGLSFLRTLLKKLPNMFHGETRDATRVGICNAGIIIFSLCQKDFVIDCELQYFLGNLKVIQSEFEEKSLNFSGGTVMVFLDSLLDYVERLNSFKVDSNCVLKIREDLAFLISLMGILMKLRKDQEDLYEGLWNLCVEMAYKLKSLLDQLVLGNFLGSFSPSFLSIATDMRIIKTNASKIFDDKEKVKDIKMAPHIVKSIPSALDHLQFCMNRINCKIGKSKYVGNVVYRLRCLRTFAICSSKLGINVELLSLWVRLDCVVCRILDDNFSRHSARNDAKKFLCNIEPFAEEMDKLFIIFSDYNFQQHTLAVAVTIQVDLIGSVVENLEDFLKWYDKREHLVGPIENLKEYLESSRNFIHFATLLCADQHQEVQDSFSQSESIAVSAAHLTLYIFSSEDTNDRIKSINSALQLKIEPLIHIYQLFQAQALSRVKYSRDQLYAPILHCPVNAMMDVVRYICSPLDDMEGMYIFFAKTTLASQLKLLLYGLASLVTFFEKLPCMFDGENWNIARAAICDAGVIMFSLLRNRVVIDRGLEDFLRCIEVIQLDFEENRSLYCPNSTLLDLLDSSLDKCYEIHSSSLRCEPTVKSDLVFLRSLTEKLVEFRKHREGLHQALWILCVKVAYKYEFHVNQMIGNRKHLSVSSLSIAADMNIIKTASFKIIHDQTIEENQRDIEMASCSIKSIHSALDHLQSCLNNEDSESDTPKRRTVVVMNRIRCLKTFVLCSTKWGNNDQLGTLLFRLDDMVSKILGCKFDAGSAVSESYWFIDCLEHFEEEMDKWFVDISYCDLQQCSSSPLSILDSLSENLEDFLSSPKSEELEVFVGRIDPLKESITFLKNFISFANLICADQHQEVRDIFTQIEAFTLSAAHLTVYLFAKPQGFSPHRVESIISALDLRIRHFQSPQFYAPTLQTKDDPIIVMMDSIDSLLSLLWNMLLSDVVLSQCRLEKLDSGLRTLKALLRKQPNKLDDKLMDMTRLAICHAGLVISLVDQNDCVIDHSLQEFQVILTEVEELVVDFPRTLMLGFLDFLLGYLTEVETSKIYSDFLMSVSNIREDLVFLKLLMGKLVELRNQQGDLHHALWRLSAATAYKIEFLIDQLVLGDIASSFSALVQSIAENMMTVRNDSTELLDVRRQEFNAQNITCTSIDQAPSQSSAPTVSDFVGFKLEQTSIMNRLKGGSKKLQVVAIVGMPGLGKTTLATKVYNEPSTVNYFQVRAWCSVSQVFDKRKVLLELLSSRQKRPPNEYGTKTADDLAEEFRRSLKGRRYLILIDDVWDINAYERLRVAFPDDVTGSRIILTTRHHDVATPNIDNEPVFLSEFSSKESLELLRWKVFPYRNDWPPKIHELGIQIAEVCKGLPLSIVMVAGLLKTSKQELWNNILQSLKSGIMSNIDQCERTIELSYDYLSDHLKPCFLSFAAFPEDHEISVKRLIWMWAAEGLVRKSGSKSLEEVATDYLQNLIGRSLVMNGKERSIGGVKACRIHDLLRDFCLKKANEEFFLHQLEGNEELISFDDPGNMRRLCVLSKPEHLKRSKMYWPRLRSLLFFGAQNGRNGYDMSFLFRIFKLLRVLDMEQVYLSFKSQSEIGFLLQLRYLAIQVDSDVNPSIGSLSNLETFIINVAGGKKVTLPDSFWDLQKLKHLSSQSSIQLPVNLESTCNLLHLDTLSTLLAEDWDVMEKKLRKFPNIRRLKCYSKNQICSWAMSFSFLMHLESLSLSFNSNTTLEYGLTFPETIKKLTLHRCGWPWRSISGIAGLPNLEVLKLLSRSFVGDAWHVEEEDFPNLKVLKLSGLGIVKWTASDDPFRNLEKLALYSCPTLEEIPAECLETVADLELIQVIGCSDSIARSVKEIEEHQKDLGNLFLRVDVRRW